MRNKWQLFVINSIALSKQQHISWWWIYVVVWWQSLWTYDGMIHRLHGTPERYVYIIYRNIIDTWQSLNWFNTHIYIYQTQKCASKAEWSYILCFVDNAAHNQLGFLLWQIHRCCWPMGFPCEPSFVFVTFRVCALLIAKCIITLHTLIHNIHK